MLPEFIDIVIVMSNESQPCCRRRSTTADRYLDSDDSFRYRQPPDSSFFAKGGLLTQDVLIEASLVTKCEKKIKITKCALSGQIIAGNRQGDVSCGEKTREGTAYCIGGQILQGLNAKQTNTTRREEHARGERRDRPTHESKAKDHVNSAV